MNIFPYLLGEYKQPLNQKISYCSIHIILKYSLNFKRKFEKEIQTFAVNVFLKGKISFEWNIQTSLFGILEN